MTAVVDAAPLAAMCPVMEQKPHQDPSASYPAPVFDNTRGSTRKRKPSIGGQKDSTARPTIAELCAREDNQELLEQLGASDELLEIWEERESNMLDNNPAQQALDPNVRAFCAWFFSNQLECNLLQDKLWYEAVLLLDVFCLRSPNPVEVADLPSYCGAVLHLVAKMDDALVSVNEVHCLEGGERLKAWLQHSGHAMDHGPLTQWRLDEKELEVLRVLQWQLAMPTVTSWMYAFCTRILTLSKQAWLPLVIPVWEQSCVLARVLVSRCAATCSLTPRRIAQGLLGIGCVALKLLAPEAMGMSDGCEDIFRNMPVREIPSGHHHLVLNMLEVATTSTLSDLAEDCMLVRDLIRLRSCEPMTGKTRPETKPTMSFASSECNKEGTDLISEGNAPESHPAVIYHSSI
jgi:hypothetical protein